jgi:hypothetical protein
LQKYQNNALIEYLDVVNELNLNKVVFIYRNNFNYIKEVQNFF